MYSRFKKLFNIGQIGKRVKISSLDKISLLLNFPTGNMEQADVVSFPLTFVLELSSSENCLALTTPTQRFYILHLTSNINTTNLISKSSQSFVIDTVYKFCYPEVYIQTELNHFVQSFY